MHRRSRLAVFVSTALTLASLLVTQAKADESATQRELRHRMEALQAHRKLTVRGVRISAVWLMGDVYAGSRFEPVWTDPKKIDDLLRAITDSRLDGLNPQDYYLDRLEKLRAEVRANPDLGNRVDLDILLTDALVRLAYNSFYGKVDPERIDPNINVAQPWRGAKGAAGVREFLASKSLYEKIQGLRPQHPKYGQFRTALAKYRQYEEAGGWGRIPKGKVLSVGRSDPRVPAIRHRLALTEDLPAKLDDGSKLYDAKLPAGARTARSQERRTR